MCRQACPRLLSSATVMRTNHARGPFAIAMEMSDRVQVFRMSAWRCQPRAGADVRRAPRHEIAGNGALLVRLALWRFEVGADAEAGARDRPPGPSRLEEAAASGLSTTSTHGH